MKIRRTLNLWASQFFKVMQLLYVVLLVALLADDIDHFGSSLSYLFGFITFMVVIAIVCGVLYMYFFNKYMNARIKEDIHEGEIPEPDDIGNQ